jgi:hypothetical protein
MAEQKNPPSLLTRIVRFYYEGFINMSSWGRKVWLIILIKVFIIFLVLKLFFFPDILKKNFDNDAQRSEFVLDHLTKKPAEND